MTAIRAAGILFLAKDDSALFLRRTAMGDCPGCWGIPGGKTEGDETAEQTAAREALEEIGQVPDGERRLHTRRITPLVGDDYTMSSEVDFTTFLQRVPEPFTPTLNGEHDGYAWAPVTSPPEPLHPGVRIALARLTMDELGVARAIAAGELTSPQRVENMSLFAIRITGTGAAYRRGLDEYVWRDPSIYLNDEFLARCNGLTVVMDHPKRLMIDAKEFVDRVVGSILLPYIKGDEVWGIAKIYDATAIRLMEQNQLSTSPGVVFRDPSVNSKVGLENGATLLIEGKPSLLDHLAICERGVWDKGGAPSGVQTDNVGDQDMPTEAEEKARKDAEEKAKTDAEAKRRADADAGQKLDMLLTKLDSVGGRVDALCGRMDAIEGAEKERGDKARKDAEDEEKKKKEASESNTSVADKAKKDAEDEKAAKEKEKEKDKERDDRARKDAEDIRAKMADMEARMPKARTDEDMGAMADAQARADKVYSLHGARAPRPLDGEDMNGYRRRLALKLQPHSKQWKDIKLDGFQPDAFAIAEGQIYADAEHVGRNPASEGGDTLREVRGSDSTNRAITEFVGDPRAWMSQFSSRPQRMIGIRTGRDR